jgi:imidazolonepropionase-like amidohydrolase
MKMPLTSIFVAVLAFFPVLLHGMDADKYLTGGDFVLRNVTVIDGLGSPPQSGQDLFISNGKITAITKTGDNQAPEGTTVIDKQGLTVMPGLIDTHTHIRSQWHGGIVLRDKYPQTRDHKPLQQNLAAYLYAGVTGIFNVGDATDFAVDTREKLKRGEFIGPRLETTGMPFSQRPSGWDGAVEAEHPVGQTPPSEYSIKIETDDVEALAEILDGYLAKDIHTIKIYSGTSAHAATFLVNAAKSRGMTTVADLWKMNMNRGWMQTTGLDGWAHATPFEISEADVRWMAENNRFVILNLTLGELMATKRFSGDRAKSFYTNPLVVDIWGEEAVKDFYASWSTIRETMYDGPESFYQVNNFGDLAGFKDAFLKNGKLAYDAGVTIMCGTDSPAYPSLWAGESLQRELELLVEAGIPPLDAIKSCTYNGAKLMRGEDRFGSVQVGMEADLLVVEGQPWKTISDTRNVEYIFLKGQQVDREKLLTSWH